MRVHRKVWLWWGKWWALQFANQWEEFPVGLRPHWRRPMLDIYFGPLTLALGRHAVYTDPRTREWDSCRGMLMGDDPRFDSGTRARVL